jgi:hypothetical protein
MQDHLCASNFVPRGFVVDAATMESGMALIGGHAVAKASLCPGPAVLAWAATRHVSLPRTLPVLTDAR